MTINEAQNPQAVQPAGGAVAPQPQGAAVADMAKAQELLLRLLTLLTPMTSSSSSGTGQGSPLSIPIEGKKYDPPGQRPDVLARLPVRLLPPLEQMRREVAQLLSTLEAKPEGEGAEGKTVSAESASKPGQLAASLRPMTTKQTFEAKELFTRPRPFDPKASPMQKMAEKAIDEVRSVIRFLATSTLLSKPNRETLQVAMKQVQPTIEHLIKTVEKLPTKPQTPPSSEPKPTWIRPPETKPLPTSVPPQELPELVVPKQLIPEGIDQAAAEQHPLSEPKVHGPVPFQQQTSSDERRRRERKKQTEKSLFWEEEKEPDSEDEE